VPRSIPIALELDMMMREKKKKMLGGMVFQVSPNL
jgi:hypothetical protein